MLLSYGVLFGRRDLPLVQFLTFYCSISGTIPRSSHNIHAAIISCRTITISNRLHRHTQSIIRTPRFRHQSHVNSEQWHGIAPAACGEGAVCRKDLPLCWQPGGGRVVAAFRYWTSTIRRRHILDHTGTSRAERLCSRPHAVVAARARRTRRRRSRLIQRVGAVISARGSEPRTAVGAAQRGGRFPSAALRELAPRGHRRPLGRRVVRGRRCRLPFRSNIAASPRPLPRHHQAGNALRAAR
jgi:hypothetical protein